MIKVSMLNFQKASLGITLCLYLAMTAVAQNVEATPEMVVNNYWTALQSGDWAKSASLVHPQSLHTVRMSSDKFVDALIGLGGEFNLSSYFQVTNKDEYQKLADVVVYERLVRSLSQQPGYKEMLKATRFKVLGTVSESENLAHVVFRWDVELLDANGKRLSTADFKEGNQLIGVSVELKLPDPNDASAGVITVKRSTTGWLIVTNNDIEEQVDHLTKSIEETKESTKKVAEALASQQRAKQLRKRKARPKHGTAN